MNTQPPLIEIRTGSDSDMPKIQAAYRVLQGLELPFSPRILSAHRTPQVMAEEAQQLEANGFRASIAAAGGAAHLPGMTASETSVPVIGLPVRSSTMDGLDSLLSIIQMPNGIPVGATGIAQAAGAALLAAQTAYLDNPQVRNRIRAYRKLAGSHPASLSLDPTVGIIAEQQKALDDKAYRKMLTSMQDLGLKPVEMDADIRPEPLEDMEQKGAVGIICLQSLRAGASGSGLSPAIAGITDLPVIGLPLAPGKIAGTREDFNPLLQSPESDDLPVAGMGVNRYVNAALYAGQIASLYFPEVRRRFKAYKDELASTVTSKDERLQNQGLPGFGIHL